MLRELLKDLVCRQSDMEVVGEALDPLEVLYSVRKTEADMVVTTLPESGEPGSSSHLLAEYPQLLVLALAPDGSDAMLYRQVVVKERVRGEAYDALLSRVRQAARHAGE